MGDSKELRELEERLLRPEVRKSAAELGSLLDDAFVEIGSSGRRRKDGAWRLLYHQGTRVP